MDIKAHNLDRSLSRFVAFRDVAAGDWSMLDGLPITLEDIDTIIDHIASTRGNVIIPEVPM